jgi:glycosyltransferase involved in cell wall biosynthesis
LHALLRAERIDVVQAHLPKANFLGLVMAWWGMGRVFVTVHNNREFDYGDQAGRLKQWLRRFGYRQMTKRCRGVIAVSEQVRRSLLAELRVEPADAGRVRVVTNGVRGMPPVSTAARETARAVWGVAPGEVLVVGVGRLTAQKDYATLLRALSCLPAEAPSWRCIVAGEGELRPELEQAARDFGLGDRFRLAGLVLDVSRLLAAADVFCLPSRFEGLPLVLLEAMAAGLPVAAFAIDGVVDVVTEGEQARLAPPGDAEALAAALLDLLRDDAQRRKLGEAGRQLVGERYGFDGVVTRLEEAYGS